MTDIEILTAIGGTKSLATLDGFSRSVWTDHAAGKIDDAGAQALAEAIHARRREVRGIDTVAQRAPHVAALAKGQGRLSHFPPKRKPQRSPDRRAGILGLLSKASGHLVVMPSLTTSPAHTDDREEDLQAAADKLGRPTSSRPTFVSPSRPFQRTLPAANYSFARWPAILASSRSHAW